MYGQSQVEHRRHSFNNNKVLVGGDDDKAARSEHASLVQINSSEDGSRSAPAAPLSNPFDNMPDGLKLSMPPFPSAPPFHNRPAFQNKPDFPNSQHAFQNKPPDFQNQPPNFQKQPEFNQPKFRNNQAEFHKDQNIFEDNPEENSDDSAYEDDLRSRSLDNLMMDRNPAHDFDEFGAESEWGHGPRPVMNQRFPRNWGPRTNFRQGFNPQFWPRNGPRPPNMGPRWGPRPQRFW